MKTQRKRIAVLFGGYSSEYEVSLQSAAAVITHMDRECYEVVPIGISRTGKWYLYEGSIAKIISDSWEEDAHCYPALPQMGHGAHGLLVFREKTDPVQIPVDAAFPVLHGRYGEDGTVQGVLVLAGIPVIGCGVLGSSLCMDKEMAHRAAGAAGVKVPESVLFVLPQRSSKMQEDDRYGSAGADVPGYAESCDSTHAAGHAESCDSTHVPEDIIRQAACDAKTLGYPLFVKPLRAGSSFGITRVADERELPLALRRAFSHDSSVIMEQMIPGFEVGCAVLEEAESGTLLTGAVDEIELSEGFFDFEEKYTLKNSKIYVPARIAPEVAERVKETAKCLFKSLKCRDFARVDFFLTPEGEIYFNEINTIPGFTEHSRYPGMMKSAGFEFEEIIDLLLKRV